MFINRRFVVSALLSTGIALSLAACSSKPKEEAKRFVPAVSVDTLKPEPAVATPVAVETDLAPANPTPPTMAELQPSMTAEQEKAIADQEKALADQVVSEERSIFFDLNRDNIKPEYDRLLNSIKTEVQVNKIEGVRIEGNTDIRGSRAYNLALGQRRADTVRDALVTLGVPRAIIKTVSYGKEKPLSTNTDEASHALNRRADVLYQGEY